MEGPGRMKVVVFGAGLQPADHCGSSEEATSYIASFAKGSHHVYDGVALEFAQPHGK